MKNCMPLYILQVIISSVFLVKYSFGEVTQACLDEMIKTKEAKTNWNGKIVETELTSFVKFEDLIPKKDKTEETTERLIKKCQQKSGIFARTLIPTGDENSFDRIIRELRIQNVLREVASFDKALFRRNATDMQNLMIGKRVQVYTGEMSCDIRQWHADENAYNHVVEERIELLYIYIDKEMENRKNRQMCKEDSAKCVLLALTQRLDALPDWFNQTAKCYKDICRISVYHRDKTDSKLKRTPADHIDVMDSDGDYQATELKNDTEE